MALVCTGLGLRYEGEACNVLRSVSLELHPGELLGIAGCSGSGKTTLLRCLAGQIAPTEGEVRADDALIGCGATSGKPVASRREAAQLVGMASQLPERQLFGQTVWEDVAFGPRNAGLAESEVEVRVSEALTSVGFSEDRALQASPFQLSGGEQRRVAIAGILALRTPYLLLDEPTAGLDPANRNALMALLRTLAEAGTGVAVVSHDMDALAASAHRVALLAEGSTLVQDTPEEVLANEELLARAGLEAPAAVRMAARLRARGVAVPHGVITPEALVAAVGALACDGAHSAASHNEGRPA